MAKQCGSYIVKGSIDNVCFYEMNGKGYARISNPLSSKRVKTAPEFAGTRRAAALLQQASPLACAVYKTLPKGKRTITHRRNLTGTAIQMLKQGHAVAVIEAQLQADALIMLAELLINEAPQNTCSDTGIHKNKRVSGAGIRVAVTKHNHNNSRHVLPAASRAYPRLQKSAKQRTGLTGMALYTYYVSLGVPSFRLPQYPQLLFCRVHPPAKRAVLPLSPQWPQAALDTGVIFNGV